MCSIEFNCIPEREYSEILPYFISVTIVLLVLTTTQAIATYRSTEASYRAALRLATVQARRYHEYHTIPAKPLQCCIGAA